MNLAPLPYARLSFSQLRLGRWVAFACLLVATLAAAPAVAQQAEPQIVDAHIGFQGIYKLGCWTPLEVELQGGTKPWTGRLVATVPDTDGVPTRVISEPSRPVGITPGQSTRVRMFVRVGQSMSTLQVAFIADGKIRASQKFYATTEPTQGTIAGGVPATNRVLLEFGPSLALNDLLNNDHNNNEQLTTRVARVELANDLPTHWYGYESIDTVLLSTSKPESYRPLLQNPGRIKALGQWVERGGQLVIFCAGSAEELLAEGGALESLAPGKFSKMERLSQAQPLATFSESDQPITRDRRVNLDVPSLINVRGQILASAGRTETNVPLVIRTRRGFGEVVFVGLDFDRPPLNQWAGRTKFLSRALAWPEKSNEQQPSYQSEPDDLSAHLRNSLDKKFVGVQIVPFGIIALLVGVYILLIGPGDYFLVKRILRRTELTWLTFPLIVLAVSAAAYGIANRMKGNQLRVNQVEIIDVDITNRAAESDSEEDDPRNLVRGTVWTHFFTPQVSEFNLDFQPSYCGQTQLDRNEQLVSWLGLPGYALGGMQASGSQTSVFDSGYQYGDGLRSMQRLPVQVWSTKTLNARWSARVTSPLQTKLQTADELLRGKLTNHSGVELTDCALLHGRWAYDLGQLPDGKTLNIDDSLQPITVKTLLTNSTAGDKTSNQVADDGTVAFSNAKWDIARLTKAMMFYESINGRRYTGQYQRYQSFVDLSHLLKHNDLAILLAKCNAPGSQWIANAGQPDSSPLASDQDRRWTYYRFLLNVESPKD